LRARICFGDPRGLFQIVERIRRIFDLNADWGAIMQTLGGDPLLSPRLLAAPGMRVPGCWDGFELTVQTIVAANSNGAGVADLAGVVQAYGKPMPVGHGLSHVFPEAPTLAAADLTACGISSDRARAIRALATAVADGRVAFDNVVDSAPLLAHLRRIAGLGETAGEYIAMRALREPDAFPAEARSLPAEFGSVTALRQRAECWRPWRAYAATYLTSGAQDALALPNSNHLHPTSPTRSATSPDPEGTRLPAIGKMRGPILVRGNHPA
jgi:AraC family transcriptional regulator of adaptative response / DNA-3-methyladenine glycosylase II